MKTKPFKLVSFSLAVILFLAGCANNAHIEKAKGADLSKYKTYGWVEPEKTKETKKDRNRDIVEQNIRTAVDEQLQKSGWQFTELNPDVLVSSDLVIEKSKKELSDPVYSRPVTRTYFNRYSGRFNTFYYPSQFMGYDRYSTTVKEGTVTVSMIDVKTDKAVWQGWATNELSRNYISDKEINKNVQSIFKKFDAGK
jgi:hypothetical protein